ncbi:uncharacterized protein VTP21DRAFT_11152 [Calcarisporiella thermophila]|uniref:uncharacterized protein n=1 Tax=Calcarisporiella thermophila TaxID=911321 RepID=UPI0037444976
MSQSVSTSFTISPSAIEQLRYNFFHFLRHAPHRYSYNFTQAARHEILLECYTSLWGKHDEYMHLLFPSGFEDAGGVDGVLQQQHQIDQEFDLPADDENLPEYTPAAKGKACGHVFRRGEAVYRCRNCALDDTCVLCSRCFYASDHTGHDTVISINGGTGGCCDCGDPEAWKVPMYCAYHSPEEGIPFNSTGNAGPAQPQPSKLHVLPPGFIDCIRTTVATILDFVLETLTCSPDDLTQQCTVEGARLNARDASLFIEQNSGEPEPEPVMYACVLWNDENHSFEQVIDQLMEATNCQRDFARKIAENVDKRGREIVEVSSDLSRLVHIANTITSVGLAVTVRSARDTFREQMSGLLIEWMRDLTCSKHRFFSNVPGSAEAFRQILCEELCREWNSADSTCMITVGEMGPELWARDDDEEFKEDIEEGTGEEDEDEDEDDYEDTMENEFEDEELVEEDIGADYDELMAEDYDGDTVMGGTSTRDKAKAPVRALRVCEDPKRALKIDWLLVHDLRLWKEVRGALRELYIGTLVVSPEYKKVMGIRFARNYGTLSNHFLLRDREMEHSVMLFSVQLFTVPSIAYMLVNEYNFLSTVFAILQMYFTKDNVTSIANVYRPISSKAQINCDSRAFKNCRYFHIFHDLRYLVSTDNVKHTIPRNRHYLSQYLDLLALFQGMNPNVRAADQHVEYESETWVHAFNLTLQLSRSCRHFSECFTTNPQVISFAIRKVLRKLVQWVNRDEDAWISSTHTASSFHSVKVHSGTFRVVKFSVASQPVSFHHPLHWFLAELFENVALLEDEKLRQLGWDGFQNMVMSFDSWGEEADDSGDEINTGYAEERMQRRVREKFLSVIDYPIRVLVLLAQIRSTLWVRNGYGIRSQAHHYRDVSLRENTYDTDIYLLQVAFALVDPDILLVSLLDRFDLVGWFSGQTEHHLYDHTQTLFLAEELLLLLIISMSERAKATGMGVEEEIRREIIHGLCMSPIAYSELTRRIPERLNENPRFDEILLQLANFKAPDGMSDHGLYELRDEYYDEVNVYFVHYTRNNREEAEEVLKKKKMQSGTRNIPPLLLPKLVKVESGPFVNIGNAMHSKTMTQIVFYALWNAITDEKITSDTLVDEALQLCVLALLDENNEEARKWRSRKGKRKEPEGDEESSRGENGIPSNSENGMGGFVRHATFEQFPVRQGAQYGQMSLLNLLLRYVNDATYKEIHPKIDWILKQLEEIGPPLAKQVLGNFYKARAEAAETTAEPTSTDISEQERKKQAAKERQAKIMEQFAKAQQSFLEKHEELYEEEGYMDDALDFPATGAAASAEEGSSEVQSEEVVWPFPSGTCIVCKEEAKPGELYGMLGLIQPSNMLRITPMEDADFVVEALQIPEHLDVSAEGLRPYGVARSSEPVPNPSISTNPNPASAGAEMLHPPGTTGHRLLCKGFRSSSHRAGTYASTCGHFMHVRCFETYCASLEQRHNAQPARNHPENIDRMEFICPLCKSLGNIILPVIWKGMRETYPGVLFPDTELRECLDFQLGSLADNLEEAVWRGVCNEEIDHWPLPTGRFLYQGNLQTETDSSGTVAESEDASPASGVRRTRHPIFSSQFRQNPSQFPQFLQEFLRPPMVNDGPSELYQELFSEGAEGSNGVLEAGSSSSSSSQTQPPSTAHTPSTILVGTTEIEAVRKMYVRLTAVLLELHPHTKRNRLRNDTAAKSAELLWDLFGYTIACNEAAQRGVGAPSVEGEGGSGTVVDGLSQQTTALLRVLSQTIVTQLEMVSRTDKRALSMNRLLSRRLRQLLIERSWPSDNTAVASGMMYGKLQPLLLEDPFMVLAELTTHSSWNLAAHHLMRLCYTAEVVRTLIAIAESSMAGHTWTTDERTLQFQEASSSRGAQENELTERLRDFTAWLLRSCGHGDEAVGRFFTTTPLHAFVRLARAFLLPFLRRCLILMHARYGIQFPRARELGIPTDETEFDRMCRYLNLPTMHELCAGTLEAATGSSNSSPSFSGLFGGVTAFAIINGWCRHLAQYRASHPNHHQDRLTNTTNTIIAVHHPAIYELVGLPHRLDSLFDESLKRVCKNCNWRPPDPALCLFCGTFVCSQSFCCSNEGQGECNIHMKSCGGEIGLYFLVKKCALLLLHHRNGSFMNPPYLDLHGEVDLGLRRGRPQFLNRRRYDEVRKLWLQHGIPVHVARKIEQSYDLGGWTTL